MKGYDTADYAATRLMETHIMYKGALVKVISCAPFGGNIVIGFQDVVTGAVGNDMIEKFDLNPPKIGYVNHIGVAHYMTRMPMRKDWKQGIRNSNIISSLGLAGVVNMKHINDTVMGKFPEIKTILGYFANNKGKSWAFDNNFAIYSNMKLEYKGVQVVGTVNPDNAAIKINDNSEWVREALMEATGEIA